MSDNKIVNSKPLIGNEDQVKYNLINTYEPLPWQVEPWKDTSKVLLLTGSAGGGKSRLAGEKIHGYCLKYPGATALIVRKVRATMANSTLLFMKRLIMGKDPRVEHRAADFRFEYDNGSILAYGGMKDDDQRERIRSIGQEGGLDIVWMEEATQFQEEDYNEILARMRGRAAPWRQIILSTNPDAPGHWINVRLILGGEASVYKSNARDNPHNPSDYVNETLGSLSGVQYKRLVLGEWAAGAGRVIDTWEDNFNPSNGKDHGGNVTLDAEFSYEKGPVVWAIDDGYSGKMDKKTKMFTGKSHPRAIMMCQLTSDGGVHVFNESLKIETLASDHIRQLLALSHKNGWPRPSYVVRDRAAASLEGSLSEHGLSSRYNTLTVEEGVKELRQWVASDRNGFRRLLVHPRCFYTRYEMQTYSINLDGKIVKEHDHTTDALRYLVWELAFGLPNTVDVAAYSDVDSDGYMQSREHDRMVRLAW